MLRKKVVFAFIFFSVLLLAQGVVASGIGYVDFDILISGHPEYTNKISEIQDIAEQLRVKFQEEILDVEDEEAIKQLALAYEDYFDEIYDEFMRMIIQSISALIPEVARTNNVSVVLSDSTVIYGGVNLTNRVIEAMYAAYGISVPSHLRDE